MTVQAFPQTGVVANSSNINDPRILFVNPGGMGFQKNSMIVAGYKMYYVGIANDNLSNGFIGFSYPTQKFGCFGVTGQYFKSDLLQRNVLEFNYSMPFLDNKMAVGINMGLLGLSYDDMKFDLMDIGDPLLQDSPSKNSFNLGVGILVSPISKLFFGMSMNHLNRPDLSLTAGESKQTISTNISLMYNHRFLRPLLNLELEDKETYIHLGIESWFFKENAMLRGLYTPEHLGFGAAYLFKKFRIDYEYEYALSDLSAVTSGFHQFMLSYSFRADIADFTISASPQKPAEPAAKGVYPTQDISYLVEINPIHGFDNLTALTLENLPPDMSATFFPPEIKPMTNSTLQINTERDCSPGLYQLTIKGKSGSISRFSSVSVKINPFPLIHAEIQSLIDTTTFTEIQEIREESPLLSYIFFSENDHELLPERYQILNAEMAPTRDFVFFPENLIDISDQYRNTLNVVAKRLWDNLDMNITVVGCNCDWGTEKGNLQLSKKRAQGVKDYLVKNCGISENRIEVIARNLPENASSNKDALGREENQRVEIISSRGSEKILEPLITTTIEKTISDSLLTFTTANTVVKAGVDSWEISIGNAKGTILKTFNGKDAVPDSVVWNLEDNDDKRVDYSESYQYCLNVVDKLGQHSKSPWRSIFSRYKYIKREAKPTKKTEKIRLILFKFDRDDIDITSETLQKSFRRIANKVKQNPEAKVIVKGYTDIIGTSDYNLELSVRRAKTIYNELIRHGIAESKIKYEGYGKNIPLLNNNLPEGRMMNRRVEVTIMYPELSDIKN